MKVVCPFSKLKPETRAALKGFRVDYVNVGHSITAYWELLSGLWRTGATFAVIEQDIVVNKDTIPNFARCKNLWCCAPYPYLGSPTYAGLGCTRFRSELMKAHPDLMDDVALHVYPGHCARHWCTLDAAIQRELWARKRHACLAHTPVGHISTGVSHGCVNV